jgi:hypothetical protein
MKKLKSINIGRYDTSTRIHFIVLYLLLAGLTILWAFHFIYFARTIRIHTMELNDIKQRLGELEATEIIISSGVNEDDGLQRRSRHARLKSKLSGKEDDYEVSDALFGAIHFKVPVRLKR